MFKKELKTFLIISFVLIGSLFLIQETKALDEANPTFKYGCHVGGDTDTCTQAFSFFGQPVGQVYKVHYRNFQNDRPVPLVEICFNNTATWGNGSCRTVQEHPIQIDEKTFLIDNPDSNTLDYKYLVIKIRVEGTITNDNDFEGLWTMHRRVVEIKDFTPSSRDVQVGSSFTMSWTTDQATRDGVTLEWSGPVQGGSGSKTVGASGQEIFACSGNGTVQLTLRARGPGENGEITTPPDTESVNCGSSNTHILTVSTAGGGFGTVTGPGISCGSAPSLGTDCSETYPAGTAVTLSANSEPGSDFREWTGDCTGSSCTLTMNSSKNVTATFNCFDCVPPPPPPPPSGGDCSPKNQSASVNQQVSINVASGFDPYSWSAPGADPSSDNDPNFNTIYRNAGNYTATVTHSGGTFQCFVNVTGGATPPPPPEQCIPNGQACGGNANRCCSGYCPSIQGAPDLCQDQSQPPPSTYQARGYVYRDLNTTSCCSGVRDSGEPVLSGEEVRLSDSSGTTIARVTTDANGFYRFTNLSPGNYRVTHTVPAGYTRTTDDSTSFTVGPDFVHDFGLYLVDSNPVVSNVTVTEPNYCISGPAATVGWTYSGGTQSAYQVQIDAEGSSFNSPVVDSGKISCENCRSYSTIQSLLQFGVTYKARVKAWNNQDVVSGWVFSGTWRTPSHAYPQVNFTFSPSPVNVGSLVQFTDQTVFYDSNPNRRRWDWNFGDGRSAVQQNPSHTYSTPGNYNVTLSATDGSGQSCSISKPLNIQTGSPIWKEVNPGG